MTDGNIFRIGNMPEGDKEIFELLCQGNDVKIERILSNGQVTTAHKWYDQCTAEFVLLVQGSASIEFYCGETVHLTAGDYIIIQPGNKHKVTYTSENPCCIWLAVHFNLKQKLNN